MSWSLEISNGDFRVDAAHLGMVTRQHKLIQDFRCAILEKMGTDNVHPSFGSIIDGGRTPDGVEASSIIGESDLDLVVLEIESELTRIARNIQRVQLARAKQDKITLGRATLDPHEVLVELAGIDFSQTFDQLRITVKITTARGTSFDMNLPIEIPVTP